MWLSSLPREQERAGFGYGTLLAVTGWEWEGSAHGGPGPQGVILSYLVLEFLEPLEGRPTALVAPEGTSLLWSWGKVGAVWIFGIYEQCFQIHYL